MYIYSHDWSIWTYGHTCEHSHILGILVLLYGCFLVYVSHPLPLPRQYQKGPCHCLVPGPWWLISSVDIKVPVLSYLTGFSFLHFAISEGQKTVIGWKSLSYRYEQLNQEPRGNIFSRNCSMVRCETVVTLQPLLYARQVQLFTVICWKSLSYRYEQFNQEPQGNVFSRNCSMVKVMRPNER